MREGRVSIVCRCGVVDGVEHVVREKSAAKSV